MVCLLFSFGSFLEVNHQRCGGVFKAYKRIVTIVEVVKEIAFENVLVEYLKKPENQ